MPSRRLVALALVAAWVSGAEPAWRVPALAAPASRQAPGAQQPTVAQALTISGTVFRSDETTPAGGVRLRLRNLDNGTVVASTVSDPQGGFSFDVSGPGHYMVEAVRMTGGVVAISEPVTLAGSAASTKVVLPPDKQAPTSEILMAIASAVGLLGWIVGKDGTTSPER